MSPAAADGVASDRVAPDGVAPDRVAPDRDWATVCTAVVGFVAVLCAVLAPVHAVFLTGDARVVMPLVAAASALVLGGAALAMHRRPALLAAPWWMPALTLVPLTNGLTHLAVTGQLEQTTTVMMTFVVIGAVISARRAVALLLGGGSLVWLLLVLTCVDTSQRLLTHYALQVLSAVTVAVGLHTVRSLRERRLHAASVAQAEQARALAASEGRYRGLFHDSPVGIGLSDERGLFLTANAALCAMLGRTEDELVGRSSADVTHPDDLHTNRGAQSLIAQAPAGVVQIEKRYVRPDGTVVWAWLTVRHTEGPQGQVWTLAHVQDVTARRATELELRGVEGDLAAVATVARRIRTGAPARPAVVAAGLEVVGASGVHLCEPTGPDLMTVTASAGPRDMAGTQLPLGETSMVSRVLRTGEVVFLGADDDPSTHPGVHARLHALAGGRSMLWQPVSANGVVLAVLVSTWDTAERLSTRRERAMALLADETAVALEHERLLDELQRRAQTDALTGLPNRRTWDNALGLLMSQARRAGRPITVAVADLDHFKAFNDAHGHAAGDAHLQAFAGVARRSLRTVDVMARWGGEEFAIALPDADAEVARVALERVRTSVPGGQTCSIGFATWDGAESAHALLARADAALYVAKSRGRDQLALDGAAAPA